MDVLSDQKRFTGSHLDVEWLQSREGKHFLKYFILHNHGCRELRFKISGLLDKPTIPSQWDVQEVSYKVMLVGKAGVGKSSFVSKLTGFDCPAVHHETPGLQTSHVYWPGRVRKLSKTILFDLSFCDAGEMALRRYDHLLPACLHDVDAILLLFSVVDRSSFDDIPNTLTRLTNPNDGICKIVLGTKYDLHASAEVTERDIAQFEANWDIPVLRISNTQTSSHDGLFSGDFGDAVPVLNTLCQQLWQRDLFHSSKKQLS